jgi:hypothetical protein
MPLPPFLISARIFTCERILTEKDDVLSAIRLVDVFFVPFPPPSELSASTIPTVTTYAIANVKAIPGYKESHDFEFKMLDSERNFIHVGAQRRAFESRVDEAPTGVGFVIQFDFTVKNLGTCYLGLYLDGEEIARSPITIIGTSSRQA